MIDFFQQGGIFMWPLALWSVLSLAFFLERVYTYAKLRSEDEMAEVTNEMNSKVDSGASVEQLGDFAAEMGRLEGEVFCRRSATV